MLQAGVSERIITPEYPTLLAGYPEPKDRYHEEVHDDLAAHCFYLANDGQEFAIVTMDIIYYTKRRVKILRGKINAACGIPEDHILISCTHTHSAPCPSGVPFWNWDSRKEMYPYYLNYVDQQVVDGLCDAKKNAFPASIGFDHGICGKEKGVGGNRRHKDGISDPEVWVLALKDGSDKLRGAIISYALHPTFLHAENRVITADFPCYVYEYLKNTDPSLVVGFQTGSAGNQSSRHFRTGQTFDEAKRVGYELAKEAQRVIGAMAFTNTPKLFAKSADLVPPLKVIAPLDVAQANQKEAADTLSASQQAGEPYGIQRTHECTLIGANKMLRLAKAGTAAIDGLMTCSPFEIFEFGIDDARMITVPCEIFVEYGLRLKQESPYEKTQFLSYSNGFCAGYVCTPEAHLEGGYEAVGSVYPPETGDLIIDRALALLNEG